MFKDTTLTNTSEHIDQRVLEAYQIIADQNPEILHPTDKEITKEETAEFAQKHLDIYTTQAEEIVRFGLPPSLIIGSCMYGGKSTLSFLILDQLKERGHKTEILIADVMGEPHVTARSYPSKGKIREARRYGESTNPMQMIQEIAKSDTEVILLDEFSFLNPHLVEMLQSMCIRTGKHIILTGLNTNYLGQPLPAFRRNSEILKRSENIQCFSFVKGYCEKEPKGTNTIRYVKIGGEWIYDAGILPLVVSKEHSEIVHYSPAMPHQTTSAMLENFPRQRDAILHPDQDLLSRQHALLEYLASKTNDIIQ